MKLAKTFIASALCALFFVACASAPAENHDAERARAHAGYSDLDSETGK